MKNILMNAAMTRAILEGRKTQTRRVAKCNKIGKLVDIQDGYIVLEESHRPPKGRYKFPVRTIRDIYKVPLGEFVVNCSPYQTGEVLWVREPAEVMDLLDGHRKIRFRYKADGEASVIDTPPRILERNPAWLREKKSVPNGCLREMARLFIRIKGVRVERLQDIDEDDSEREGLERIVFYDGHRRLYGIGVDEASPYVCSNVSFRDAFGELWDKTAPAGQKWRDNPFVFVYEFERVEREAE